MAKPAARIVFLEAMLVIGAGAVVARSFWAQIIHHDTWIAKAHDRRTSDRELPARRGRILDRTGQPLAVSQEQYRLNVTMKQLEDSAALRKVLTDSLKVPKSRVDSELRQSYAYFHGPFRAEQVALLRRKPGIYLEPLPKRVYPIAGLARHVIGVLNESGTSGIEGIEKALDSVLQGKPGTEHDQRDARGHLLADPGPPLVEPVAGRDVVLTIDADMQGIAEGALWRGIQESGAHGGDVVVMDVHTGELFAVASLRTDTARNNRIVPAASAITEPNEPGSTSKLFTVAALLRYGRDTSAVDGENGLWKMPYGPKNATRTIEDVHKTHGMVSVAEAVKVSSNIALSKFSLRLSKEEQYQTIRDFGFGSAPGLGFPGEARGKLYHPAAWVNEKLSKTSHAMGYEWEASAVQLAVGYAAIANHGVLVTPTLVREVRDEHGVTTWTHRTDTVRHAVPDSIAQHLMEYLRLTEGDGGTGAKAQLDRFKVPGKTGTAKVDKTLHAYRGSYVGLFPDDKPQVVVYVMIDRTTKGSIYGGDVAAPIVRLILQQTLAARTSPLDRSVLIATVPAPTVAAAPAPVATAMTRVSLPVKTSPVDRPYAVVPDLSGFSARQAVAALERAGLQTRLIGRTHVRSTAPVAGDSLLRGATVTVYADSLR